MLKVGEIMDKRNMVKEVYKILTKIFLQTNERIVYYGVPVIQDNIKKLFPEINFDKLIEEVNFEINKEMLVKNTGKVVVGYKYGNPLTLHSELPLEGDFDVVLVFSDGSQEGYSYCNGKLTRDRC